MADADDLPGQGGAGGVEQQVLPLVQVAPLLRPGHLAVDKSLGGFPGVRPLRVQPQGQGRRLVHGAQKSRVFVAQHFSHIVQEGIRKRIIHEYLCEIQ